MKRLIAVSMIVLAGAYSTSAADKAELDDRIRNLTSSFIEMQRQPGKCIPADVLQRAQGVVLLSGTKAGFLFAYQAGSGVALAHDPHTGAWSPAGFLRVNQPSLGLQVGGEQNFVVIVLMGPEGRAWMANPGFELGSEVRSTAGDASAGLRSSSYRDAPALFFSERKGLFAGASVDAGAIAPDEGANRTYYGRYLTMGDILFGRQVGPTPASSELVNVLTTNSRQVNQ